MCLGLDRLGARSRSIARLVRCLTIFRILLGGALLASVGRMVHQSRVCRSGLVLALEPILSARRLVCLELPVGHSSTMPALVVALVVVAPVPVLPRC